MFPKDNDDHEWEERLRAKRVGSIETCKVGLSNEGSEIEELSHGFQLQLLITGFDGGSLAVAEHSIRDVATELQNLAI